MKLKLTDNMERAGSFPKPLPLVVRVDKIVCARHGCELMGLKSPVCDPVLSLLLNMKY